MLKDAQHEPGATWAPASRATTCGDGHPGATIKAARVALGWSQTTLASTVGFSQSTVSRLESGRTRVHRDVRALQQLGSALGVSPSALGLDASSSPPENDEDMQRRTFLRGGLAAAMLALLPHSIATAGRISPADVAEGWQTLERIRVMDQLGGGAGAHELAAAVSQRLQAALNSARLATGAEVELQALTATFMRKTGWVAFDAGDIASARRWWLEASHLGEVSHPSQPRAHALMTMALHTSGHPDRARETVRLASAARTAAGAGASPVMLSIIAAREALGHAQQADRNAACQAIALARRHLDRGPDGSEAIADLLFWGPADLACHESRVAFALGDARAAEASARAAVTAGDSERFPRNVASYAADLSNVLTRSGKIDEAITATSDALERTRSVGGSKRVTTRLTRTVNALGALKYAPAQEFYSVVTRRGEVTP